MPADPTANLGKSKLPTDKKDIGHVAPTYTKTGRLNTLVLRPVYRISLRLGDIDRLFPWAIDTKAGRLARLQALGMFYWPLNHRVAAGNTAKPAGARVADNQAAYIESWKYFKEKFCGVAKATLDANPEAENDKGEIELAYRLKEWIVQRCDGTEDGSSYNPDDITTGGGELPVPAEEDDAGKPKDVDETEGHFAKIRLPGGWRFLTGSGFDPSEDTSMATKSINAGMYDPMYDYETKCYENNPALGKIPLIATVEKLDTASNEWKPVKDAWAYFQLLPPYDLPDFDSGRKAHTQLNRPDLIGSVYSVTAPTPANQNAGQGPKYFMEELWDKYQYDPNVQNPQANNAHEDCGGLRKTGHQDDNSDVEDILFSTGTVEGFSAAHADPPADILDDGKGKRVLDPAPDLKEVKSTGDTAHHHAVKAQTNAKGEAGVIFTPSRCGGDRYRIRAYLGPNTVKGPGSDGGGDTAVRVDTGTFVVWRSVRMSRFITQAFTSATQFKDKMVNQYFERADNAAIGVDDKINWSKSFGLANSSNAWIGLPALSYDDISDGVWQEPPPVGQPVRAGSIEDGIRVAFAKGFCEFDFDPGCAANLDEAEWKAAVQCAIDDAKVLQPADADAARFDLDVLLYHEAANADINLVSNGFMFPARNVFAYTNAGGSNAALLSGPHRAGWKGVIRRIFQGWLYPAFMRHMTRNGYLPGLTIIQGPALTNLESEPGFDMGLFGIGTKFAGAFVMQGQVNYATTIGSLPDVGYGYTACVVHEAGHVIFKVHAPGLYPMTTCAAGAKEDRHDSNGNLTVAAPVNDADGNPRGQPKHGTCVMSYRTCEGFLCSRCLLQLRGWNILANKIQTDTRHP